MFLVKPCASSPCKNGGTCYGIEDKFMCECAEGFDGDTCEDKGTIKGNDYNINISLTVRNFPVTLHGTICTKLSDN